MSTDPAAPVVPDICLAATTDRATALGVRRTEIAVATVILLVLILGFWPAFEGPAVPMDEGTLLVYPELIQRGQLPYRDFETFYGPANPWVLAATYSVFGTSIFVERAVGLVYRVVILLAIFGILKRWGVVLAGGGMFIAGALLLGTQLPAFAWMGALACGLSAMLVYTSGESRARCALAGFLSGVALLFRPDLGPAVMLAALPLLYATLTSRRWNYIGGFAAGLLPLALLTVFTGPTQVLNNLFLYPVVYSNPGRRLPLSSADPYLLNLLLLHGAACVLNLTAGFVALRRDRSNWNARVFVALAIFSTALTSQVVQRPDFFHFLIVGAVSISLVPVSLVMLSGSRKIADRSRAVPLLATAVVIAVFESFAPEVTLMTRNFLAAGVDSRMNKTVFIEQGDRSYPFGSEQSARNAGKLLERLETLSKPGERLFVGPADLRRTNYCDTFIYHLLPKLRPASYFLEMNPLSANRVGSRLASDVQSADWLVLDTVWDSSNEKNGSATNGPDSPNEIVRAHFRLVAQYGPFVLLQRNQ